MKTEKCTRPVMALAMYALLASCGYYPSVDARTERAAASLAAGDYAAAESELAVVLKREPTHGKALLGMTKVELKLGRADAARSYLARAQQARADAATIESLNTEVLLAEGKLSDLDERHIYDDSDEIPEDAARRSISPISATMKHEIPQI